MIYPDSHFHLLSLKEKGIIIEPSTPLSGIDIGTTCSDIEERRELIKPFKDVRFSLGCGPWCVKEDNDIDWQLSRLEHYINIERPVAIGEIGLDYYRKYETEEKQRELFISQIKLANKYSLPVIIHTRDADNDTMEILEKYPAEKGGIIHCFSSHSLTFAEKAIDKGFLISFSGNVTFKSSKELQEIAKQIPSNCLLAETDSPYITPVPMRGKINTPMYVKYVYSFLASLKGIDEENFREQLILNLDKFYKRSEVR